MRWFGMAAAVCVAVCLGLLGGEAMGAGGRAAGGPDRPMVNMDENDVALGGHCVMSLHEGKVEAGDPMITASHNGAIYRFSSAAHRNAFRKDPARYAPKYGGYCAYGVTKGKLFPVELSTAKVVDGHLYLNKNAEVSTLWQKDIPGYIKQAEEQWQKIKPE